MFVMTPDYALLPSADALPPYTRATMKGGYDRRIPGAAKAPELGMMAENWDRPKDRLDAYVEVKVDGWRAIYLGGDKPRIVTREGEPLLAADHMLADCQAIERLYGEPMMFDGEFAAPGGIEATSAAARAGSIDLASRLWLFDAVPLSAWLTGTPYSKGAWERSRGLLERARRVKRGFTGVLLPQPVGHDAEVMEFAERVWRMGGEGAMVKDGGAAYERRRSSAWRKVKRVDEITVTVVDTTDKGTLVCQTDRGVRFNVGVGIDEQMKAMVGSMPQGYVGRDAVIQANGFTKTMTPRHARFIRMAGTGA